jgi:hypothetical protein
LMTPSWILSKIAWLLGFNEVSAFTYIQAVDWKDAEPDAYNCRIFRFLCRVARAMMQAIAESGLSVSISHA